MVEEASHLDQEVSEVALLGKELLVGAHLAHLAIPQHHDLVNL